MKSRKKDVGSKQDTRQKLKKIWDNVRYIGTWAYKLRSVLLSIPVAIAAISLAIRNMAKLPEQVGLNLQANGEYAMVVGRGVAVMGPLAVTAVCLLLMFCSRRVVYPWLISLFSLVLPLVILFTNTFPY
ncbi:MAG: hypothetical protein IKK41_01295 [Oscillospiraceae bacterium]|nr:hypothetical protein [Oscillospiraceae bacterium]